MKQSKREEFEKVAKSFRQIQINIFFNDAIFQISFYTHFLKDVVSKKRKIEDHEMIALTKECSAHVQNKLPPKLEDSESFIIPCTIGHLNFSNVLCDLGASIFINGTFHCPKA